MNSNPHNDTLIEQGARHVVVVGAGGNIGSHLTPHLARTAGIQHITLIDHDSYEEKNLKSQAIDMTDIGRPKVAVQLEALLRIAPELQVEAIVERVENVPLGKMRCDLILACLDSRASRCTVNRVAQRLGVPWIDSGVMPNELLARVNVYPATPESACYECSWTEEDYSVLEEVYPCSGKHQVASPTNGISSLGALAASIQAIECMKFLQDDENTPRSSEQILMDASHHRLYRNALVQNHKCLFEHRVLTPESIALRPESTTLRSLLVHLSSENCEDRGPWALRLEGKKFAHRLTCINGCGDRTIRTCIAGRIPQELETCAKCKGSLHAVGFFSSDSLSAEILSKQDFERRLCDFGLRTGDIFSFSEVSGDETLYEIGAAHV